MITVNKVQWNAGLIEGAVLLMGNEEMKESAKLIRHLVDVVACFSERDGSMEDAIKKLERTLFDVRSNESKQKESSS
jgi:hypothetical protein